jgi:thioredoxin-related protein
VDGIKREFSDRLTVIQVNIQDPVGRELGRQFNFQYTPTFILFDGDGEELWRTIGAINPSEVRQSLGAQ